MPAMDIRQTTAIAPGHRQVSMATAVNPLQPSTAAEGGTQYPVTPETGTSPGGSSLTQRVARWSENSVTVARKLVMPAQLNPLSEAEVTAASFQAKAEGQAKWSNDLAQALEQDRSPALRLIQHDMQLSLLELRAQEGEVVPQESTDTASALVETTLQPEIRLSQLETFGAAVSADDKAIISSWDIFDFLQESISEINDSYLSTYTDILSGFNAFFSDFADFKSNFSKYVTAGTDGKIMIQSHLILDNLESLITQYSSYPLYPGQGKSASEADAKKWAKEMGLPDSCIHYNDSGGAWVALDTTPLNTIKDSIANTFGRTTKQVDSAQYQAWLAGFDMQADKYQNFMQVMTQKYTTANSVFDNLIKVLSSTITSLLESDKSFFNI